jgi:hypothetical protein
MVRARGVLVSWRSRAHRPRPVLPSLLRPGLGGSGFTRLIAVSLALVLGLVASGCGSQATDAGGFTGSLRHSAQAALNGLQYSAIPQVLVGIDQTAQVLNACTVHLVTTKPLVFRLFLDWNPAFSQKALATAESDNPRLVRFTWFDAIIPANGDPKFNSGQILADVPIQKATHELESHFGPAFVDPFENCEVLRNGSVYGYAYGTLTAPISTLTTPTTTTP